MTYAEDKRYMGHEQRIAEGFMAAPKQKAETKPTVQIRHIRTGRVTEETVKAAASLVKAGTYEYIA